MRRNGTIFVAVCMILALLLTGCTTKQNGNSQNSEATSNSEDTGTTQVPGNYEWNTFFEKPQDGNLAYITNDIISNMNRPEIYLIGNNLLFVDLLMDEENSDIILKMISLEDGKLVAEKRFFASGIAKVQIGEDGLAIVDSGMGILRILDEKLNLVSELEDSQEAQEWYVSSDMEWLYILDYTNGISAVSVATGERKTIFDKGTRVEAKGEMNHYVVFSYMDKNTQKLCCGGLDLNMGKTEVAPFAWNLNSGYRYGVYWLLEKTDSKGEYILINEAGNTTVTLKDSKLWMLGARQKLLQWNASSREITLYDMDGKFISKCTYEGGSDDAINLKMVWSGYLQGYFFMKYSESGNRLVYWDAQIPTQGENLTSDSGNQKEETSTQMKALRERAEQLNKKYGVDIRLGDECQLDYSNYTSSCFENVQSLTEALNLLDECFSKYPKGFFEQLKYGSITSIQIELVRNLTPKDANAHNAAGFAQENQDHYLVVFDVDVLSKSTVYHEFAHVIDHRLAWDALFDKNALFSEEKWLKLQPKGFAYANSYTNIPESVKKYYDSGYFTESYSCTFPTEDRATMMESAMEGHKHIFEAMPKVAEKLRYYSQCIRDCFDTTGWPEKTTWEASLQ